MEMSGGKELTVFETVRIQDNALDAVHIGDFYWVKFDKMEWNEATGEREKTGEYETLMCVETIGSNYFGFTIYVGHGSSVVRVHFNEFEQTCRPEPNWKEVLNQRMEEARKAIQDKTQQLIKEGQKLCLLPEAVSETEQSVNQPQSILPARVSVDPNKYKNSLIKLQKRMPDISNEIRELGEEFGIAAKNLSIPDLAKLNAVKEALGVVEDRIFTIELYCGILEQVKQIATGEPAPLDTTIVIRQQMLYMDEETLFNYDDGGMDFSHIKKFDEWVTRPDNLNRILPEQRGIVAFRVRRSTKDYGTPRSFAEAWTHMNWKEANEDTYLLIRNGENVYRISSEVDFSPRLIPKEGEIGKDQFTKISERYLWNDRDEHGSAKREITEEMVTPDSTEFDDHVKKAEKLLRHYNRIVILIQGLLDRSTVFHPHARINLRDPRDMELWITLIRDEERGLPSNKVTFEEYQKQLNSSLKKGKWVYVDSSYDEGYEKGEKPDRNNRRDMPRRRGWAAFRMPDLCVVDSMKRDGSMVRVSWPWGRLAKGQKRWVESPTRPGWGHNEYDTKTDRMCHEWIPINRVLNVSNYNAGDYKMFLCDRSLRGQYIKWAQYLLTAEDWARDRAKGLPPENDIKAQPGE